MGEDENGNEMRISRAGGFGFVLFGFRYGEA